MSTQPADSEIVAGLIHDALWAEGGETVEGAFVDRWVSNASLAYNELTERFQEHGFSDADAELFRQAMRREPTDRMVDLLDALRTWTESVVRQMLDDPEPRARATALGVAWRFLPVTSLVPYLKDPDATVRAAALNAVCDRRYGVPEPERKAHLEQAFADPSPEVRRAAGLGFVVYGKPEVRRNLAHMIENEPDKGVHTDLVTALARETARSGIGGDPEQLTSRLGPELRALLIQELNNDDPQVRKTLAEALVRLRGRDVGNALLYRLAMEESGDVRFAMRHYSGFDEVLDRALEVFAHRLMAEPEPWIREKLEYLRLKFFRQLAAALRREEHDGELRDVSSPSPELAAAIQRRIDALPGERGIDWPTSVFKLDLNALPLHSTSALYCWGIRPDGTVVCLDLDTIADAAEVETNPLIRFVVIVQGAVRYPELRKLIPTPPEGTRLCKECGGVGSDPKNSGQTCSLCNGYGWRSTPPARHSDRADPPNGETARPSDSGTLTVAVEPAPEETMRTGPDRGEMSPMFEPQLYSPRQLPDLPSNFADEELRFEWDQNGADSIVRHTDGSGSSGVVLWRECIGQTGQQASERFAEIAEVLRYKYGENLKDLVPTPAGHRALRSDGRPTAQSEATARVAAARAAMGTAPETQRYDWHSLTFAIRNGDQETIRRFLAQGGDPNTAQYGHRTTLLHVAAERRQEAMVRMLLCAGADPDIIDSRGLAPLGYALNESSPLGGGDDGHESALAIARLIVEAGASLDVLGEARGQLQGWEVQAYKPPLALAARHGNVGVLRFLLESGADPGQADRWGMTALHYAASGGVVETARLLCEAGADPNAAYEPPLWTPLHSVIYSADARKKGTTASLIRLLVQAGADIDKGESHGDSPLFATVSEARHDLVRLLLELGAKIHHRNHVGDGAAAFLVRRMQMRMLSEVEMLPILQTLLSAGADPWAASKSGQSAYDLAREYDFWDIAAFLKAI